MQLEYFLRNKTSPVLPDLYVQVNLIITVKEKISINFLGKQFGKKRQIYIIGPCSMIKTLIPTMKECVV